MTTALEVESVSKSFVGIQVLNDVSLAIGAGEIHALVGQNGAGKSTLVKTIAGLYRPDSGKIVFDGEDITGRQVSDIARHGIAFIHQELDVIESFSVRENIFLGSEPTAPLGFLRKRREKKLAERTLQSLDIALPLEATTGDLPVAQKQLTVITRALLKHPKLLILDEPTSRLSMQEVEELFRILKDLSKQGVCMLYISHRLEEIYQICHKVSVLKNGDMVGTFNVSDLGRRQLVRHMVGHDFSETFPEKKKINVSREAVKTDHLKSGPEVENVSFSASIGEIVALVGAVGAGKSEILRILLGERKMQAGTVVINGHVLNPRHPGDFFKMGCSYCPEDRKNEGLILTESIGRNITITSLSKFTVFGALLSKTKENRVSRHMIESLDVACRSTEQEVTTLSGGNQQKVVLAKWLQCEPAILVLDEPTIGIDVESRLEVYRILRERAAQGACVLVATSDIQEALGLADRIVVIYAGRSVAEFETDGAKEDDVLFQVMGGGERADESR